MKNRCAWSTQNPFLVEYHDTEWGVPLYDDRKLFEFLILEGAQAGLSWLTVLKKRENYRKAFDRFNPQKVAAYDRTKIRNRLKVEAAVQNAKAFLKIRAEFGSFSDYSWRFVNGEPIVNRRKTMKEIPATSAESEMFSEDLKKRGFRFVGSTIIYAHMQAVGMVNDHTVDCFRYRMLIP